jgi:threonine dehydrogenase-like Zn-dependent dehydrogenase
VNRPDNGVTPLGHEASGVVAAIGAGVEGLSLGQRVVINPLRTGNRIGIGGPDGAFTEEMLVADARVGDNLLPFSDTLPFEIAALTEPLAVALHGINRGQVKPGDRVAVFGCGPIGLAMILWLAERGVVDVAALDLAPERLQRARALGACVTINPAQEDVRARLIEAHGSATAFSREAAGTDVFIDAAGAPNILNDVVRMAKTHARLVVTAAPAKPVELDLRAMMLNEMSITTALGYPQEMPEVLAALPGLKTKAASLISHRFPFDATLAAFGVAGTPKSAKVMVEFEDFENAAA